MSKHSAEFFLFSLEWTKVLSFASQNSDNSNSNNNSNNNNNNVFFKIVASKETKRAAKNIQFQRKKPEFLSWA
jgi:hypothetical protein